MYEVIKFWFWFFYKIIFLDKAFKKKKKMSCNYADGLSPYEYKGEVGMNEVS